MNAKLKLFTTALIIGQFAPCYINAQNQGADHSNLDIKVSASAYSTDNLNANALSSGDDYYVLTPEFSYSLENSRLSLKTNLSFPINRFSDQSIYDSEDIVFSLGSTFPFAESSPFYGNLSFSYSDTIRLDYQLNSRYASETMTAGASGGIKLGKRLNLRGGVGYNKSLSENLADYQAANVYGGIQFNELIGSANGFVDYRYQIRETIGSFTTENIDDYDSGIRVGLNGQILPERLFPKLQAELSFGISRSEDFKDSSGDRDFLTIDGSLEYPITPKNLVSLEVSRNLGITQLDQNVETSVVTLHLSQSPRQRMNLNWTVGYEVNDYDFSRSILAGRKDSTLLASGSVSFTFSTPWSLSFGVNYRDSDSNIFISDYSSTTYYISTSRLFK